MRPYSTERVNTESVVDIILCSGVNINDITAERLTKRHRQIGARIGNDLSRVTYTEPFDKIKAIDACWNLCRMYRSTEHCPIGWARCSPSRPDEGGLQQCHRCIEENLLSNME